ncbi:MAG: hypothetical protein ACYCVZ_16015 [Streptosporangiaceae bacterium]
MCLSDELAQRLPAGVDPPAWDLFAAVWPLAVRVAELEHADAKRRRKARKKAARAERGRDAAITAPGVRLEGLATAAAVARSVPLAAGMWRVALEPGLPAEITETETA